MITGICTVMITLIIISSGIFCWAIVRGADDRNKDRSIEMDCKEFAKFMNTRK